MCKFWKEKVKVGKVKDVSGFGGKGLERLDKECEVVCFCECKIYKVEGEEEEDKGDDKDEEIKKDKVKEVIQVVVSVIVFWDVFKMEVVEGKISGGFEYGVIKSSGVIVGSSSVGVGKGGGVLDKVVLVISEINV